jgi:hypothetical protein
MQFFAILTLAVPGQSSVTAEGVVTLTSPATRQNIFQYMRQQVITQNGQQYAKASVVFFSAEPNTISA